jgi:hypothetical protein
VLAGIDRDFAEGIEFFHRHREFLPQQVHQSRNPGRSPSQVNSLDILAAGGGAEEVKSLLNFQNQNVGNGAQNGGLLLLADAGEAFALLQLFRVVKIEVQFLL